MAGARQILWKRISERPFLIPKPGTLAAEAVTTPDVLFDEDRIFVFVGAVSLSVERIIRFELAPDQLETGRSLSTPQTAQVVLDAGAYDFSRFHVFDPAVIRCGDQIKLYFSGIGTLEDSIGLATSENGGDFLIHASPILVGRSPEIIVKEETFFLFYVKRRSGSGYQIFCATSPNGHHFAERPNPVLIPGWPGEWDSYEVTTPRIFIWRDWYCMLYAGDDSVKRNDLPAGFGLARSKDLINWEKFPHNPVFECGEQGQWDDGAIWFGTVFEYRDRLYLLYEGGRKEDILSESPSLTQVGLGCIETNSFAKFITEW